MTVASTPYGPIEYQLTGTGPAVLVLKGGHCSRSTRLAFPGLHLTLSSESSGQHILIGSARMASLRYGS